MEWLGEGDARTLLEARQAELDAAERAVKEAREAVDASRTALEQTRGAATQAGKQLTSFANKLSGAWGRLGEDRDVAADPASLRVAFVSLGEAVLARHADAEQRRAEARDRIEQATSASAELLSSVGLAPGDDFRTKLTEAGVRHGAAAAEVTTLEAEIGRANELEGRIVDAESRRDLARRLSDDLKPSRFLAFLLEEERAELAELGSEHFEQLTDGAYRFADDGSFAVQDLNAAGQVRKADSLSGDVATVGNERRALRGTRLEVRRHLVAVRARDERAHLDAGLEAVADLDLREPILDRRTSGSATSPTATTTEIAMQRSPAEP